MARQIHIINYLHLLLLAVVLCLQACESSSAQTQIPETIAEPEAKQDSIPQADGFDFPVGPPDAKAYYNAQPFGRNLHLGDDWNGVGGGNSDLGDPVYSVAHGKVLEALDHGGGWGKVIRVVHRLEEQEVESLYAHLDTMLVEEGDFVERGDQIGTIGNVDGIYWAHLHLEIRSQKGLPLGGGYSADT
ncbi:MAG: M23 family metallopeptidase, partial [Bacteroidota bacterium]